MLTATGVLVLPTNDNVPTLADIAASLALMPRFACHASPTFTVGQHSLACAKFASFDPRLKLHMLLHDAHESVTGEVPRSWKPQAMKDMQKELDARLYRHLGIEPPTPREAETVGIIDNEVLYAEAVLLGPPGCAQMVGRAPTGAALQVVQEFMLVPPIRVAVLFMEWLNGLLAEPHRVPAEVVDAAATSVLQRLQVLSVAEAVVAGRIAEVDRSPHSEGESPAPSTPPQ